MTEFGDIYRRHAKEVYRFALGLCGDHHRAEELAAEAFERALLSSAPIRAETVRAYLFTIARNVYLQSLERSRRLTTLEDEHVTRELGQDVRAEQRDQLARTLAALQRLPETDRAALLMHAEEEMSYQAIANALGISLAAVKVRIHRARIRLAQMMEETK
jgi:RNA polymerase sigma-70 factor (ECF subfamily)